MRPHPTNLQRLDDRRLRITWSDGSVREYAVADLRAACPCATCREKRNAPPPPPGALTVLSPEEARPVEIESMKPIGNYAYGIAFSDGHNTGIYTFEELQRLGKECGSP